MRGGACFCWVFPPAPSVSTAPRFAVLKGRTKELAQRHSLGPHMFPPGAPPAENKEATTDDRIATSSHAQSLVQEHKTPPEFTTTRFSLVFGLQVLGTQRQRFSQEEAMEAKPGFHCTLRTGPAWPLSTATLQNKSNSYAEEHFLSPV
jgi:hypothetical protein